MNVTLERGISASAASCEKGICVHCNLKVLSTHKRLKCESGYLHHECGVLLQTLRDHPQTLMHHNKVLASSNARIRELEADVSSSAPDSPECILQRMQTQELEAQLAEVISREATLRSEQQATLASAVDPAAFAAVCTERDLLLERLSGINQEVTDSQTARLEHQTEHSEQKRTAKEDSDRVHKEELSLRKQIELRVEAVEAENQQLKAQIQAAGSFYGQQQASHDAEKEAYATEVADREETLRAEMEQMDEMLELIEIEKLKAFQAAQTAQTELADARMEHAQSLAALQMQLDATHAELKAAASGEQAVAQEQLTAAKAAEFDVLAERRKAAQDAKWMSYGAVAMRRVLSRWQQNGMLDGIAHWRRAVQGAKWTSHKVLLEDMRSKLAEAEAEADTLQDLMEQQRTPKHSKRLLRCDADKAAELEAHAEDVKELWTKPQIFECIIPHPGVGYRFSPLFADKNLNGKGPKSTSSDGAVQHCQVIGNEFKKSPEGVTFLNCSTGNGWLPLSNPAGTVRCFKHLGGSVSAATPNTEDKAATAAELEVQLADMRSKLAEAEAEADTLQGLMEQQRTPKHSKQHAQDSEDKALEIQLADSVGEMLSLKATLSQNETELAGAFGKVMELEHILHGTQAELVLLTKSSSEDASEAMQVVGKVAELEVQLAEVQGKLADAEAESDTSVVEAEALLTSQIKEMLHAMEALKVENSDLLHQSNRLQEQLQACESQMTSQHGNHEASERPWHGLYQCEQCEPHRAENARLKTEVKAQEEAWRKRMNREQEALIAAKREKMALVTQGVEREAALRAQIKQRDQQVRENEAEKARQRSPQGARSRSEMDYFSTERRSASRSPPQAMQQGKRAAASGFHLSGSPSQRNYN